MAKVVACIVARTVSTRLPLKVLRHLTKGLNMLDFLIDRLKHTSCIDEIFICTSNEPVDEIMEDIARQNQVGVYRGSPDQVIERMIAVGKLTHADIVLRITGDNPLTSFEYIDRQIKFLVEENLDYVRLIEVPLGATAEVMKYDALLKCNDIMDPSTSEYLMLFIFEPKDFRCGVIKPFKEDFSFYTITVDTTEDLMRTRQLMEHYSGDVSGMLLKDVINIYQKHNLASSVIKPSGKIKLPYGKEISYSEFKIDMDRRINSSRILRLYE